MIFRVLTSLPQRCVVFNFLLPRSQVQDFKEAFLAVAHFADFASSYVLGRRPLAAFREVVAHESSLERFRHIDVALYDEAVGRVRVGRWRDHLFAFVAQAEYNVFHISPARKPTCFSGWEELPSIVG